MSIRHLVFAAVAVISWVPAAVAGQRADVTMRQSVIADDRSLVPAGESATGALLRPVERSSAAMMRNPSVALTGMDLSLGVDRFCGAIVSGRIFDDRRSNERDETARFKGSASLPWADRLDADLLRATEPIAPAKGSPGVAVLGSAVTATLLFRRRDRPRVGP